MSQWWDFNLNFVYGCAPAGEGCRNCWAARMTWDPRAGRPLPQYDGLVDMLDGVPTWNGRVRVKEKLAVIPNVRRARVVSVQFMGDLFGEGVPAEIYGRLLSILEAYRDRVFVILTKHPERIQHCLPSPMSLFKEHPNLWILVSVSDQDDYSRRWPALIGGCLPVLRGISYEPALGPLQLLGYPLPDWVIMGSENGPDGRRRPMALEWAQAMVAQCRAHYVPLYYKQGPNDSGEVRSDPRIDRGIWTQVPKVGVLRNYVRPAEARKDQKP